MAEADLRAVDNVQHQQVALSLVLQGPASPDGGNPAAADSSRAVARPKLHTSRRRLHPPPATPLACCCSVCAGAVAVVLHPAAAMGAVSVDAHSRLLIGALTPLAAPYCRHSEVHTFGKVNLCAHVRRLAAALLQARAADCYYLRQHQ